MSKNPFQLTSVHALPEYRLKLEYADGKKLEVDLSQIIFKSRFLRPLIDKTLFAQARLGFMGGSVDWVEDELDLGADNLRNMAIEQAGGIGHERIWRWLHETGLTVDQAADALGISRRTLICYRDGEKTIPRHIWLACLGWQAVRPQLGGSLPTGFVGV